MENPETSRRARFDEMVGHVIEPIRRYLLRRLSPATADDIVHEVLTILWNRKDTIPRDQEITSAIALASRQLQHTLRTVRDQKELARILSVDPPLKTARDADVGTSGDRLREALIRMRPEDAEILRLHAWDGLTLAEIALVLGWTPDTASNRLHRARTRLTSTRKDAGPGRTCTGEGRRRPVTALLDPPAGADDIDQLLKEADPASTLLPLMHWQLERLTSRGMKALPAPQSRRPRSPDSRTTARADATALDGRPLLEGTAGRAAVTALASPPADGPAVMCAEPTARGLASSTLAFRGTVTSVQDGTVSLRVEHTFTGTVGPTVTLPQGDPDSQIDGSHPVFENGRTYLVAATDHVVRSCGLTGTDSAALTALYDQAFPR